MGTLYPSLQFCFDTIRAYIITDLKEEKREGTETLKQKGGSNLLISQRLQLRSGTSPPPPSPIKNDLY